MARISDGSATGLIVLALCLAAAVAAAEPSALQPDDDGLPRVHFGFKAGLALAQHQGTEPREPEYTVSSTMRRGVAAGVFMILPVTRRFGLQQEILYVQKGSHQDIGVTILDIPTVLEVTYEQDYLEIPLLLRYHWLLKRDRNLYTLGGFAFGLKIHDRYRLSGSVSDGTETVTLSADDDMSEVDIFDFAFTYGVGVEFPALGGQFLVEYRFDLSLGALPLPTYAYVPFGDEEPILVDNEPVPLRNQCHMVMLGVRF